MCRVFTASVRLFEQREDGTPIPSNTTRLRSCGHSRNHTMLLGAVGARTTQVLSVLSKVDELLATRN